MATQPLEDPILEYDIKPDGKKFAFSAQKGWFRVPMGQTERTTIRPSTLERVGKGVDDLVSGVKQGLLYYQDPEEYGKYTKQKDAENAYYDRALNEYNIDGIDAPRLAGQVGISAPVGLVGSGATTAGHLLKGGIQGGLASGAMYTPESGSKVLQTGLGVVAGGVGNVAVNKAIDAGGVVVSKLKNAFDNLKSNIFPDEKITVKLANSGLDIQSLPEAMRAGMIKDAREQLRLTGKLDPEALSRKANAESLGFRGDAALTTAQATRDPQLWAREIELAKKEEGLPILGRLKNQNSRLTTGLRQELPKSKIEGDEVGESIFKSTTDKWRQMQEEVGKVYKRIDNEMEGFAINGMPDFENYLKVEGDDSTITKLTESVLARGKRIGLFGDETRPVTMKNVEQFRKYIGGLADGNDPTLMMRKREIIDMLDDNVVGATGNDAYKIARAKAQERFAEFETKLVNSIVNGKATPDKLFQKVLTAPRSELEALKHSLTKSHIEGQEAIGADTWAAIKSETLDHLWNKATQGMGADGKFSGTMFKKEMDKIGQKKLQIIFDADELAKLKSIQQTSLDLTREPTFSPVNYSGTASEMYNMLSRVPHIGEIFKDAAGKQALEMNLSRSMSGSPAVRLSPEEVVANVRGLLDVSPVMRGLLANKGYSSTIPAMTSMGLLNNPDRQ